MNSRGRSERLTKLTSLTVRKLGEDHKVQDTHVERLIRGTEDAELLFADDSRVDDSEGQARESVATSCHWYPRAVCENHFESRVLFAFCRYCRVEAGEQQAVPRKLEEPKGEQSLTRRVRT